MLRLILTWFIPAGCVANYVKPPTRWPLTYQEIIKINKTTNCYNVVFLFCWQKKPPVFFLFQPRLLTREPVCGKGQSLIHNLPRTLSILWTFESEPLTQFSKGFFSSPTFSKEMRIVKIRPISHPRSRHTWEEFYNYQHLIITHI